MSATYGYLWGNRGQATRGGSAKSGIRAHLKTWTGNAHCHLSANNVLQVQVDQKVRVLVNGRCVKAKG